MKLNLINTIYFVLTLIVFAACKKKTETKNQESQQFVAIINNKKISLKQIDSLISPQLFELRMNALEMLISRNILENEAKNQKISLEKLVEKEIIKKAKKVTSKDIGNFISQSNIENKDTNNAMKYLTNQHQKERQIQYVDSMKNKYSLKISLQPSYFNKIDTTNLYCHNLTENNSKTKVFIISDFNCPSCQKAERKLKYLYEKYNKNVNFKFIYFSGYFDNDALACEAAAKQGKFRNMHDIIFENVKLLNKKSIYFDFAKTIGLDINKFKTDMQDKTVLRKLLKNKEMLISNNIYSTPTFIVNNMVLDGKYAVDYLEDVIIKELNLEK
ncbi:MAG: thioredoxin domain-containing protein [Bacteroidales bacterium]|jgi:predicted DsbA family dithiol-disulfide isomerase